MVNGNPRIGLSHLVPEGVSIVHSTVSGRKSFGRIADLLCAWSMEEQGLPSELIGALRILISALLESLPESQRSPNRIEMAIFEGQVALALRTEWSQDLEPGASEKALTQHWLKSPEMQILRRSIDPRDLIEVRHHSRSRLVEWRVLRSLSPQDIDPGLSSFSVFEDASETLEEPVREYQDLGDLPFQNWLEDAYQGSRGGSASGEIRISGDALQQDLEYARIKVSRELDEIETRIRQGERSNASPEVQEEEEPSGLLLIDDLIRKLQKKEDVEEELTALLEQFKSEARERRKELSDWKKKHQKVVDLLNRKEMALYTQANELRLAQSRQESSSGGNSGGKSTHASAEISADLLNRFREKAILMHEKLKVVTEQNEKLKKDISLLKNRSVVAGEYEGSATVRTNTEDLEKKLDRTQRALDSEKAKTSALLERALSAEKDSQGSAHLITDLENKVEHALKTSMQYKKEVDALKQKLVQADAEKNVVKNDLLKAQAQIQTLLKRQAG